MAMSEGDTVDTATGVSRATATSITSDTTVISYNILNKESAEADASCALTAKLADKQRLTRDIYDALRYSAAAKTDLILASTSSASSGLSMNNCFTVSRP